MTATGDLALGSGHVGSFYDKPTLADWSLERPAPVSVVIGRGDHGVTRLAVSLTVAGGPSARLPQFGSPGDAAAAASAIDRAHPASPLHVHVTDGLLGPEPVAALTALARGRPLAITLHDVPLPAEGEPRFSRRRAVYRDLCAAADLVIVCSEHERALLAALGVDTQNVRVVPLPIDPPSIAPWPEGRTSVGVLGWIHPGKGHAGVLRAMAESLPGATLVAIGAPSPHHPELPQELSRLAADLGVGFELTGPLSDAAILHEAATVRVPVCSHLHISASASLGTWMTAGRAPLAFDGGYVREIAARCPGAVQRVARDGLAAALVRAADAPESTVLRPEMRTGPSTDEVAALQAGVLDAWVGA